MNRTVVVSCNAHDNYLFFLPLVSWAWRKLGWDVFFILICDDINDKVKHVLTHCNCKYEVITSHIEGIRSETLSQVARLYAANLTDDEYFMTSDADMIPLSGCWKPSKNFTSWGHDLTGYQHFPICYLGGSRDKWKELLNLSGDFYMDIQRDIANHPFNKSLEPSQLWVTDQEFITEKLKDFPHETIDRNPYGYFPLPIGRVDRYSWDATLLQKERIDAHLLRPGYTYFNFTKIMDLIKECFEISKQEEQFLMDYKNEYITFV